MIINNFNINSPYKRHFESLKSYRQQSPMVDTFIRSDLSKRNEVAFTGITWSQKQIDKAVDSFSDGVIKLAESGQLNLINVRELVKKCAPDSYIVVEELSKLEDFMSSNSNAICISYPYKNPSKTFCLLGINFERINKSDKNTIAAIIADAVHEFSHSMTETLGKDYFYKHIEENIPGITEVDMGFGNLLSAILKKLHFNEIPFSKIERIDDTKLLEKAECSSIQEMQAIIKETIKKYTADLSPENKEKMKFILKYSRLYIKDEERAYKAGFKAYSKFFKIDKPSELDLLPYFLAKVAKYVDSLDYREFVPQKETRKSSLFSDIRKIFSGFKAKGHYRSDHRTSPR